MRGGPWSTEVSAAFAAALACAALLAWLLCDRRDPGRARLLLATGADPAPRPLGGDRARLLGGALRERLPRGAVAALQRSWARAGRAWWCLPAGGLVGALGESWIPAVLGLFTVPVAGRLARRRRAREAAERTENAVIDLCADVAGELRGGRLPAGALLSAGAGRLGKEGAALLAAARFGGDVPAVLHRAARLPGAHGLTGVAACWQVATDGGAGLADGLDRVADALRAERDQRDELRAQLAGPRSTAVVLALLPAFGLLLGTAMGAEPLHVLLHSPVGLGCLAVGGLLEWAGLAWVARLVRTAEEES
ncbi:type II secretion system F family protein [Streptomyces sp. DSM 42041]|uniref:Type II secretion system F family protein n=1 Tax=Streptomyces hazeniae TaxID=3075538 RepID=A0ABU2NUS9_9ACTN|nr:type II secretion system F family protein [Streptomyces sp. DSM 42041]MDT0380272.1 type II secretion system F family protein [Streptomyces sp. DSM 42041]